MKIQEIFNKLNSMDRKYDVVSKAVWGQTTILRQNTFMLMLQKTTNILVVLDTEEGQYVVLQVKVGLWLLVFSISCQKGLLQAHGYFVGYVLQSLQDPKANGGSWGVALGVMGVSPEKKKGFFFLLFGDFLAHCNLILVQELGFWRLANPFSCIVNS